MSYPINQKINPYQQQTQPAMGFTTPAQMPNSDAVAQGITQNSVLKGVSSGDEKDKHPWLTAVLTIPVAYAMISGMAKFNNACKDLAYGNTILGKAANLGDKISDKLKFVEPMINKMSAATNYVDKKFVSKFDVLSTFFHGPAKPENNMALTMAGGSKTELAGDAISKLKQYVEHKHDLKTADGTILKPEEALKTIEELEKDSHSEGNIKKIVDLCKAQGDASTEARQMFNLKTKPLVGRFFEKLPEDKKHLSDYFTPLKKLGRKVYFSEYVNKIETFTNPHARTQLGKFLPKAMIRCLEGLTNGTAGGKLAMAMGAYFVADAIKKGIDAPKGETVKTAAENLTYNTGWYLTMPLGLSIMNKIGGLQYSGMGKGIDAKTGKNVIEGKLENYRAKYNEFNEKAKHGLFADKKEYNDAEKELDALRKTNRAKISEPKTWANVLTKPFRAIGHILDVGLETKRPYVKDVNPATFMGKVEKFVRYIPYGLKQAAGYPMRFGVFMFLIAPPLAKIGAEASHVIFGRPTKSVLDEEKDEDSKAKKEYPPLLMPQYENGVQGQTPAQPVQSVQQPAAQPVQPQAPAQQQPQVAAQTQAQQPANQEATDNKQKANEPVRTYIPSSAPVKINPNTQLYGAQEQKINKILQQSAYAEQRAAKFLPGDQPAAQ